MNDFIHQAPTLDNYWRSIILFGCNVASYKFALAQTLLDFRDRGSDLITLDELAAPFSKHVCLHIKNAPKQATSPSSKFLDACKSHNKGETTQSDLITTTSRIGFNNVIDAFHMALLHKSPLARIHCVNPTPNDLCNKAGACSRYGIPQLSSNWIDKSILTIYWYIDLIFFRRSWRFKLSSKLIMFVETTIKKSRKKY